HQLVLELLCAGKVAGLRIDHPDGLYDPRQYLERLQEQFVLTCARCLFEALPEYRHLDWKEQEPAVAEALPAAREAGRDRGDLDLLRRPLYVVVEKVRGANEALRPDSPTDGTTGYDYLNLGNGLFVDTARAQAFTRLYRNWTGEEAPFSEVSYQKKLLTLRTALSSELQMLAHQLDRLAQRDRGS